MLGLIFGLGLLYVGLGLRRWLKKGDALHVGFGIIWTLLVLGAGLSLICIWVHARGHLMRLERMVSVYENRAQESAAFAHELGDSGRAARAAVLEADEKIRKCQAEIERQRWNCRIAAWWLWFSRE